MVALVGGIAQWKRVRIGCLGVRDRFPVEEKNIYFLHSIFLSYYVISSVSSNMTI